MIKQDYLNNHDVTDFVKWAADTLPVLKVNLDISKRGTGRIVGVGDDPTRYGPGVKGEFIGVDEITNSYQWLGCWSGETGIYTQSSDWTSTKTSLHKLGKYLKNSMASSNPVELQKCCRQILIWGGDRNPEVGAGRFMNGLNDRLANYLTVSKREYTLASANTNSLGNIHEMNAMLTKVHALASDDGLPIYDSRVAAAIACLVEIYRQSRETPWEKLPESLVFKAVDRASRRRVNGLGNLRHKVKDPGIITRQNSTSGKQVRSREWASSKIRLGWLMEAIVLESKKKGHPLFRNETLLDDSMVSNLRAFEAALFMIGFDVSSLSGFQSSDSRYDRNDPHCIDQPRL